ncbi:hypothetical protein KEM64_15145 [Bacillus velezensis]|uniref:hypothetical protein n=1 Tax=Bacillus velezensis TaxID=492670 RepID=UPI001BA7B22D|nr:hypothetical protein [Bacillus velezensis]QUS16005.1 hypothetical protein KEM64_15145 [Bacillus velezensis]WFO93417.1 hypothetical protein JEQ23_04925 [Bacillus velezensis]WFO93420.1 hypothetical protein JEQ23_05210 [Bacillus velezensis]WFO97488.1 hypothetical protein JEQ24_04915 [Bacillus velezensis]WGK54118.1 hypothetical protein PO847_04590 [Bacillus velezensis]
MSGLSQEQINKNLFDEVQRLKKKSRHDEEEIRLLKAENKRYRNALEFYADDTTYTNEFEDCPPAIDMDWGAVAKTALEGAAE